MFLKKKKQPYHILPDTKSINWFYVFFISWLVNLAVIILSRYLINYNFDFTGNLAYAGIAFYAALISCVGWLGFKVFARSFIIFNVLSLAYMLFIVITKASDGWSDLTSLVGFIFLILFGTIAATSLQLIVLIIKKTKKKRSR